MVWLWIFIALIAGRLIGYDIGRNEGYDEGHRDGMRLKGGDKGE